MLPESQTNDKYADVQQFLFTNNLFQLNYVKNHQNNILDLTLTNIETVTVLQHDSLLSKEDLYHPPLNIKISLFQKGTEKVVLECLKTPVYDYLKINYLEMYNLIQR